MRICTTTKFEIGELAPPERSRDVAFAAVTLISRALFVRERASVN